MEAVASELADLKKQLAVQATQISQLNTELGRLQARLPWQPIETFDLFPKLPIELRREIWRFALPGPRLLTLKVPDDSKKDDDIYGRVHIDRKGDGEWDMTCAFGTFEPERPLVDPPALLYVCKESRNVTLMEYEFCMSTFVPPDAVIEASSHTDSPRHWIVNHDFLTYRGFRFQPARDTVYIKEYVWTVPSNLAFCRPTEIKTDNIRFLALTVSSFLYGEGSLSTWLSLLFNSLEELILIAWDDDSEEVQGYGDLSVTEGRKAVQAYVQKEMQERPNTRIPILRVMTEKLLAKYVSDKHLPEKWQDSKFKPFIL